MLNWLFKKFPAYADRIPDSGTLTLNVTGNALIAIPFIIIGLLCIVMADDSSRQPPKTKQGVIITQLFGYFLICCGISRIVDLICIWHNYANLAGCIRILTGLIALGALIYIPIVIRESMKAPNIQEIDSKLAETKEKLTIIENLTKKLDK